MSESIAESAVVWLATMPHLSSSCRAAYRGEVNRFSEFQAAENQVLMLVDLQPSHWTSYLTAAPGTRRSIQSKRVNTLKASSVRQALRICRKFLLWCAEQRLISWVVPRLQATASESAPARRMRDESIPRALTELLLGAAVLDSEEDLRAALAINLAYWGTLGTGEICALRNEDLSIRSGSRATVRIQKRIVALPEHLAQLYLRYSAARADGSGRDPVPKGPLLSHLQSDQPLRAWTVWSIARRWQRRQGMNEHFSPQRLRSAFLSLAMADGSGHLPSIAAHAGNKSCIIGALRVDGPAMVAVFATAAARLCPRAAPKSRS